MDESTVPPMQRRVVVCPSHPGRGRHLPRGSVLYSTIWSRFQKLRLLTFCFTQKIPLLDLLLHIISNALLTCPRKVEGSKWIYPSSEGSSCVHGNLPLQNPKGYWGPEVSCPSPNSASLRSQFTLTLCYLLSLTHHLHLLPHSRFKY